MNQTPAGQGTSAGRLGGSSATPQDFVATLAAMQDQIDDLIAIVEAHQKRLDELMNPRSDRPNGRRAH